MLSCFHLGFFILLYQLILDNCITFVAFLIIGYKPKSVRKRKNSAEKENIRGNSNKRFTYPFSPLTPTSLESVISNCNQEGRQSIVSPTGLSFMYLLKNVTFYKS